MRKLKVLLGAISKLEPGWPSHYILADLVLARLSYAMSEEKVEVLSPHDEEHRTYILVTGANRSVDPPYIGEAIVC